MEKIAKMFSFVRRFTPRKTAAVLLAASAVVVPAAMFAFGPNRTTFTIEKPANYVTFNSITNNPNIGDERNFVGIREANGDKGTKNVWYDKMNVQEGKEYYVRMYVHNNASANLKLVAQNTRAHFILPTTTAKNISVNGYITSDNAKPNKIWDEANFMSDRNFNLAYVKGSAKYENNKGTFALPESIFTESGALLGYDKMNGQIPGCFQYAGYVTFKVKPQFAKTFELNKTVRESGTKEWKESVNAKPGDKVDYQIMVKNISGAQMNNVMVLDTLPKGVKYVAGSTMVANPTNPKGVKVSDNLTTKGINIGNYANQANAYIKFSATVTGENLACGANTLRNVAKAESDFGAKTDTADVIVQKDCTPPPVVKKNPSYDLIKTVDRKTAKPGETINYTLTFKNTGDQDLTNVIIRDQLPAKVSWTNVKVNVKNGEGVSNQKELFADGLKIAKVNVGGSVTVKISAKIAAAAKFDCGETALLNKAESKTDQKKDQANNADEDNAKNNSAKTVVSKECEPETPPTPPTPPEVPPVTPPTPPENPEIPPTPENPGTPPTVTTEIPQKPSNPTPKVVNDNPTTLASTGAGDAIMMILATGVLTFGGVAYLRSRRALNGLNR